MMQVTRVPPIISSIPPSLTRFLGDFSTAAICSTWTVADEGDSLNLKERNKKSPLKLNVLLLNRTMHFDERTPKAAQTPPLLLLLLLYYCPLKTHSHARRAADVDRAKTWIHSDFTLTWFVAATSAILHTINEITEHLQLNLIIVQRINWSSYLR